MQNMIHQGAGGRRGPVFGAALDSRRLQNVGIVYTCECMDCIVICTRPASTHFSSLNNDTRTTRTTTDFKKSFASTDELLRTILALDRERIPAERLPGTCILRRRLRTRSLVLPSHPQH